MIHVQMNLNLINETLDKLTTNFQNIGYPVSLIKKMEISKNKILHKLQKKLTGKKN